MLLSLLDMSILDYRIENVRWRHMGIAMTSSLVVKPVTRYSPRFVKGYPFPIQQSPLHFKAALVTAKMSVRANGAVTRYNERKRVVRQSISYSPCAIRFAQMRCDESIGADAPSWDLMLRTQNSLLKPTTQTHIGNIERKCNILSLQHLLI